LREIIDPEREKGVGFIILKSSEKKGECRKNVKPK
jgi:hypothetical protein